MKHRTPTGVHTQWSTGQPHRGAYNVEHSLCCTEHPQGCIPSGAQANLTGVRTMRSTACAVQDTHRGARPVEHRPTSQGCIQCGAQPVLYRRATHPRGLPLGALRLPCCVLDLPLSVLPLKLGALLLLVCVKAYLLLLLLLLLRVMALLVLTLLPVYLPLLLLDGLLVARALLHRCA